MPSPAIELSPRSVPHGGPRNDRQAPHHLATRTAAIVLAGTQRWGESPFDHIRGPLVPVALAPLIQYPLTWLRDGGVHDVTICANSATTAVRNVLGDGEGMGMALEYFEDRSPRGAAGCVRDAAAALDAETLIVVEGAMIPSVDIQALLDAHRRSGAAATAVTEIDRRRNSFSRTRPRTPGGIYVFERGVLELISRVGYQDIKEGLLERLYRAGAHVMTHEVLGVAPRVLDYGTYLAVNRWLIERAVREHALSGYERRGDALCHPTAQLSPEASVVGPVLVGAGAIVEGSAVVVGPTAIGPDARVERGALVARSILWRRSRVRAGAQVDGSMVTDGADVASTEHVVDCIHTAGTPRRVERSAVAGVIPAFLLGARSASVRLASGSLLSAMHELRIGRE